MKLALRDRVHAVVYAYETGLLVPHPPATVNVDPASDHPAP